MNFELSDEQTAIKEAIKRICNRFNDNYWKEKDLTGQFPFEFHEAISNDGWLGIAMPEEFGGSGLGITDAALMMETISASGAGFSGASAIHMNIFGLNPVVVYANSEQKKRWLPPLIAGQDLACFGVTEPNTGLNTAHLKTKARRVNDEYIVSGQKIWISTAQVATKILLLARTAPIEDTANPIDGLTLFYTDVDRKKMSIHEIEKMGRKAVDSNQIFIDDLRIPLCDRIGEEGKGFRYILDSLNPERILVAAEAVGLGQIALDKAVKYAGERIVFNRPIGKNQSIQHPLALRWIELEAARLLTYKAASLYDLGKPCGAESNAAKYFAGEAGFKACETSILTHGGMGYAKEFHVERYFRESMIPRIVPVSSQLILCFIAERVLGMPKSY